MNPRRSRVFHVAALIILTLSLSLGLTPAAAGEPPGDCDVKVSLNHLPYVDDDLTAWTYASLEITGTGWPPLIHPELSSEPVLTNANGQGARTTESGRLLGSFFAIPNDPLGTYEITVFDPENPLCADSFTLHHVEAIPYFHDIHLYPNPYAIVWLYEAGLTDGCWQHPVFLELRTYCPHWTVTRDQMATFLVRALDLPATTEDAFDDDNSNLREWAINRLAAAGIATGCGERLFCPRDPVTRAEMASFLVRAFEIAPSTTDAFDDDTGSTHEADINALAAAGVATGCARRAYCPEDPITRYEIALLFYRLLAAP